MEISGKTDFPVLSLFPSHSCRVRRIRPPPLINEADQNALFLFPLFSSFPLPRSTSTLKIPSSDNSLIWDGEGWGIKKEKDEREKRKHKIGLCLGWGEMSGGGGGGGGGPRPLLLAEGETKR